MNTLTSVGQQGRPSKAGAYIMTGGDDGAGHQQREIPG